MKNIKKVAATKKVTKVSKKISKDTARADTKRTKKVITKKIVSKRPVLAYWNIRGYGASIHMLLYYLDIDFEDRIYNVGPAPDYDKTKWNKDKHSMGFAFPNLPYFIDGKDVKLTETAAIL